MSSAFARLWSDLHWGYDPLFGDNAGSNPTEFFSEASERFFTVPLKLRHSQPEVYAVLEEYYGLKTIEWFAEQQAKHR
jgi:Mlc titration factor MtfA (ptsG expression regulator)